MYTVRQTQAFQDWVDGLRDRKVQVRVATRVRQAELGNLGDHQAVGGGVSEMRVHLGPGYRLYFTVRQTTVIFMLVGGDKSSQSKDIARAKRMATQLE